MPNQEESGPIDPQSDGEREERNAMRHAALSGQTSMALMMAAAPSALTKSGSVKPRRFIYSKKAVTVFVFLRARHSDVAAPDGP
jgi:hypothetical protein